jgi:hypothetical protein
MTRFLILAATLALLAEIAKARLHQSSLARRPGPYSLLWR